MKRCIQRVGELIPRSLQSQDQPRCPQFDDREDDRDSVDVAKRTLRRQTPFEAVLSATYSPGIGEEPLGSSADDHLPVDLIFIEPRPGARSLVLGELAGL